MNIKLITLATVMGIISALTGCFGKTTDAGKPSAAVEEVTPTPLPEGTHVTRLYAYRTGSMMEMCYILCEKEDGFYIKTTYDDPYQREETNELPYRDAYVYGVSEVFEDEWAANSVKLPDEAPLREIEAVIEQYGALGWDGWNKEKKLPAGVMDGDYFVRLYIELSDGTSAKISGSNTSPPKYGDFHYEIEKIFTKTVDSYLKETENDAN